MAGVFEEFLIWSRANQAAKTYRGYKGLLQSFLDFADVTFVRQLKPIHITKWLEDHKPKGQPVTYPGFSFCHSLLFIHRPKDGKVGCARANLGSLPRVKGETQFRHPITRLVRDRHGPVKNATAA